MINEATSTRKPVEPKMKKRSQKVKKAVSTTQENDTAKQIANLSQSQNITDVQSSYDVVSIKSALAQRIDLIYEKAKNQRVFQYSLRQLLQAFFLCFWARSRHRKVREEQLLRRGTTKLDKDLDICNLLQVVNWYKAVRRTLFTDVQRLLLELQPEKLICSDSEAETSQEHAADSDLDLDPLFLKNKYSIA